ncbi:hypothetical protein RHSIM_Rhsim08G0059100 [Rhododendron simsii]|uniref:Peptidase metallopeptidase domain-containing protein n=1 Tax=Rhododendron simsii TaxID=118357 RepID=A0A834GGN6_RHOSS|nr:hypothetical protein RHSIM_Rhsim08G0059100 [Rhododendron simsii]
MTTPRCGVPDIVNGTNWMRAGQKKANHAHNIVHTVSHFSFFPGNLKWPPTKYQLTYAFPPGTNSDAMSAVAKAFSTWASKTQFTFSESPNHESAYLKIGFYRGDHGDGAPFNGPNGVLAHAFAPTDGRFHYNKYYSFSVNPVGGSFHTETVALHKIGHLLGLGHSEVQEAIMFLSIAAGTTKGLNADDIQGIKTLYDLEAELQCDDEGIWNANVSREFKGFAWSMVDVSVEVVEIVGYFVDKKLPFTAISSVGQNLCGKSGLLKMLSNEDDFFFFQFDNAGRYRQVVEAGPCHFGGKLMVVKPHVAPIAGEVQAPFVWNEGVGVAALGSPVSVLAVTNGAIERIPTVVDIMKKNVDEKV